MCRYGRLGVILVQPPVKAIWCLKLPVPTEERIQAVMSHALMDASRGLTRFTFTTSAAHVEGSANSKPPHASPQAVRRDAAQNSTQLSGPHAKGAQAEPE